MTIPANARFTQFSCQVPDSAIDYNGHLNDAAYAQVLTDANEEFLDALGLSASYREATGCSMYTVEITIKFLREVSRGETLRASSQLHSHDTKRVRLHTSLLADDGAEVATGRLAVLARRHRGREGLWLPRRSSFGAR